MKKETKETEENSKDTSITRILLPLGIFTALLLVFFFLLSPIFKSGEAKQDIIATEQDDSSLTIDKIATGSFDENNEVFFTFTAPVDGRYYFQQTTDSSNPDNWMLFRLFNKKGKEINDGAKISESLKAGKHSFSIISRGAKDYSFIITKDVYYETLPVSGKEKLFANAQPAPMYQDIELEFTEEKKEVAFVMEVTEPTLYQIRYTTKDILGFYLYNDKFVRIDSGNRVSNILLPGTYYLAIEFSKPPGKGSAIITKEGEYGWEKPEIEVFVGDIIRKAIEKGLNKSLRKTIFVGMSWAIAYVIVAAIFIIAYNICFKPYMNFMKNSYGYKVLGLPFWLMLAGISALIILPLFGLDPLGVRVDNVVGGAKFTIILLFTIVAGFTAMSIILFLKSRKIYLIPINIVVMLAFFYFLIQFILYAILIIVGAIVMYVGVKAFAHTAKTSSKAPKNPQGPGVGKEYHFHKGGYIKTTDL
ncbi:MAG: hypothetical protein LBU88_02215 [Treponema sp.]|jgi:hypothetical protein|nr:hypothetical protein [Treponema sp.]